MLRTPQHMPPCARLQRHQTELHTRCFALPKSLLWLAFTAPIDTVQVLSSPRNFTLGGYAEGVSNPNLLTYPITLSPASGVLQATGNQASYTPDQPGVYEARYRADNGATQSNRLFNIGSGC